MLIVLLTFVWTFASMTIAVRQGLTYNVDKWGRPL